MKSVLLMLILATSLIAQSENATPRYDSPLLWPDSTGKNYYDTVIVNGNPFVGVIVKYEHGTLYLRKEDGVESPISKAVIDKIIFKTGEELLGPKSDSTAFNSYFSDPFLLHGPPSADVVEQRLEVEANKHLDRIATTLERMFILQVALIVLGVIITLAI